jgi:hypothetical protein
MRLSNILIAFTLALFGTTTLPAGEVYVPIAGSVGVFRTDTRIFNPSRGESITVTASFLPAGRPNLDPIAREVTVGRRQMLAFDDVVGDNAHAGPPSLVTIPPFGVLFPLSLSPSIGDLTNGWVTYEASRPIFGFGSVVDNGTTDPTFIAAFEDTPPENSLVLFDEAHHSRHSPQTTFAPFARLLRSDGWEVESSRDSFDAELLARARIVVIVNALAAVNVNNWTLPTPSAFTTDEIAAVRDWVAEGGSLLLIADHMPFPGANADLAAIFGIEFSNGFAFDPTQLALPETCLREEQVHIFRKGDGTLREHAVTSGVASVGTFTGSAFRAGSEAEPLMLFGPAAVSLEPTTAWEFLASTPRIPVGGWQQGALLRFGQGRVAVFGEAAMFSEQTCGPGRPMGMNSPAASDNARFVLNVIRWLGDRL